MTTLTKFQYHIIFVSYFIDFLILQESDLSLEKNVLVLDP